MEQTEDISPEKQAKLDEQLIMRVTSNTAGPLNIISWVEKGACKTAKDKNDTPAAVLAAQNASDRNSILGLVFPVKAWDGSIDGLESREIDFDINLTDRDGRNPIFYLKNFTTMALLLARGLDGCPTDNDGTPPLTYVRQQYDNEEALNDRQHAEYGNRIHMLAWCEWIATEAQKGTLSLQGYLDKWDKGFRNDARLEGFSDVNTGASMGAFAFAYLLPMLEQQGDFVTKEQMFDLAKNTSIMQWGDNPRNIVQHLYAAGTPLVPEDLASFPQPLRENAANAFITTMTQCAVEDGQHPLKIMTMIKEGVEVARAGGGLVADDIDYRALSRIIQPAFSERRLDCLDHESYRDLYHAIPEKLARNELMPDFPTKYLAKEDAAYQAAAGGLLSR